MRVMFSRVDQRLPQLDVCTLLGMKPCLSDGRTELQKEGEVCFGGKRGREWLRETRRVEAELN